MTIDVATWSWPQWVVCGGWAFSLTLYAINNGKDRHDTWNFPVKFLDVLFAIIVLSFGGFFA